MIVSFLAFSFAASATYVLNDLWDLEDDRAHPRKCLRPLRERNLPDTRGLAVAAVALLLALVMASVSPRASSRCCCSPPDDDRV